MATLTYDPTPADQPEFNEAEQEALAIGEQAEADQQQMLAGKFKDAEALDQAYIELQKKLGEPNDENETKPAEEVREQEDSSEEEVNPNFDLLNKASQEFYSNDGQVSSETLEELGKLDSNELISAYIQMQGQQQQGKDLTDAQAWLVIHDLTNDGVPMALRDVESDEDANAAKILKSAVAGVANTVMVPFEATAQAFKKKKVEEIDEELPTEDTVEE